MKSIDLTRIEADIDHLAAGAESIRDAEETLLRIAGPLFEANGYAVVTPRRDPDSGVDLVAVHDNEHSIGVLFKASVHRLGVSAIRELIGEAQSQLHSQYLLMTSSDLTSDAAMLARQAASLSVNVLTIDSLRGWIARCSPPNDET